MVTPVPNDAMVRSSRTRYRFAGDATPLIPTLLAVPIPAAVPADRILVTVVAVRNSFRTVAGRGRRSLRLGRPVLPARPPSVLRRYA